MAVNGSCSRDDPIARKVFLVHIKILGGMLYKQIVFMKSIRIEQSNNTLTGGQFPNGLLFLYGLVPSPF